MNSQPADTTGSAEEPLTDDAAAAAGRYCSETFSPEETAILDQYFTNTDRPVFAVVNLPEVVKGALFARYSRTHKSLRRLFLDEFAGTGTAASAAVPSEVGSARAQALYQRVFFEFGDDSVAQLGGVHLACEQASNVLTKILEWGRLAAYLEQSTRYIAYDKPAEGGGYRYHVPVEVRAEGLEDVYRHGLDTMFDNYSTLAAGLRRHFEQTQPQASDTDPAAWAASVRAKALDAARGMLPAAATSNLGIYATGQSYETMLLRMRSHELAETRDYAAMMLVELRKTIPAFLSRVDVADRGLATSAYQADCRSGTAAAARRLLGDDSGDDLSSEDVSEVALVDFDPDAETKLVAAMLYPYSSLPETVIQRRVAKMTTDERIGVVRNYCGDRRNRRHRPGRAFERCFYRFDILSDYGAFRDLQRHRMLTIDWQPLGVRHGYIIPDAVGVAGYDDLYRDTMNVSADLSATVAGAGVGSYPVALAYRLRYSMQMNAREAMHMLELRTTPQGHPSYRRVCQRMHTLIAECAGHHAVAEAMSFVDHTPDAGLGRLEAENRLAARRQTEAAA